MKIADIGAGTFTRKATERFAGEDGAEYLEVSSLEEVAKSMRMRIATHGTMAYYNYLDGLVQRCLDIILEEDLRIERAARVNVNFGLGEHPKNRQKCVVYSHEKALAQCSDYLGKYPGIKRVSVASTAAAASLAARDKSGLAIADIATLQKNGLDIVAEDIANKRNGVTNYTDFFLVVRSEDEIGVYEEGKEYSTMVAITPRFDKVGLLSDILTQFRMHGINIAKIHSRPSLVKARSCEAQMFYLELMTSSASDRFRRCTSAIEHYLNSNGRDAEVVRVLGSYERPRTS